MSATLQTSSTKLDVASASSSILTSPAAGVGEGAVATPFATLFVAVQANEEVPAQTVVGETLTHEDIGACEQTNSILAPRQNLKPEETVVEGEELELDPWPDFAAVPAWSILSEKVVLAEPAGAPFPVNLAVSIEDAALFDEGQSLLIEPVDLELSADFSEQFVPKLLVAQGEQEVPVIDATFIDDPLLKTAVTSIKPVNTVGLIKLAEELANTTAPRLGSQAPIKGASGTQNSRDLADPVEDLAVDLDVPVGVPMPEKAADLVRATTSVHPLAAIAIVMPERVSEVEKNQISVDGLNEDVLSDDSPLEAVGTRPAVQTNLGEGVTNVAFPQATQVVHEAAIQRAAAQSNLENSLPKDDPNTEPALALTQASATMSKSSNVASQTAPTAFASGAGAAVVLDLRRQGWTKTLVNRAASMAQAGGSMTLSILPQNLGQITLKLSDGRKGLELRMMAEVASTTAMLRDVQGQIESAFDQAGLKLGSYSAQTGGRGQQGGSDQNAPQDDGEIELLERNAPAEKDRIDHEDPDRLNILL